MDIGFQGIMSIENEDPILSARWGSSAQPLCSKTFAPNCWKESERAQEEVSGRK